MFVVVVRRCPVSLFLSPEVFSLPLTMLVSGIVVCVVFFYFYKCSPVFLVDSSEVPKIKNRCKGTAIFLNTQYLIVGIS